VLGGFVVGGANLSGNSCRVKRQPEIAVNYSYLFFLSIYNLFINKNYYLFINIKYFEKYNYSNLLTKKFLV